DMVVEQAGDRVGVGGQADNRSAALAAANQLGADADVGGRQFRGQSSPPSACCRLGYLQGARRALETPQRLGKRASRDGGDHRLVSRIGKSIGRSPWQKPCLRQGLTP